MRHLILLILFCLIVASCDKQTAAQLEVISSYIFDAPDSAYLALTSVDNSSLYNNKLRAQHALLTALALNRKHCDTLGLDLLQPAVHYYRNHGPLRSKMQLEYCLGWICYNQGSWSDSYIHLLEAEKMANSTNEAYFNVLIYSALASVCGKTNQLEEWLRYAFLRLDEAKKTDKPDLIARGYLDLAMALGNNHRAEEADSVFQTAINQLNLLNNPEPELLFAAHLAITKQHNDPRLACELYERMLSTGTNLPIEHWHAYAYALQCCGRDKETFRILDSLESYPGNKESHFWRYKVARRHGDYLSALEHCENYCSLLSRELTGNLNNSIYKAIADQNDALVKQHADREERLRLIILLLITLTLAIFGIISLLLSRRKARHKAELERLETLAETARQITMDLQNDNIALLSQLDDAQRNIDSLYTKLEHLRSSLFAPYQKQLAELGRLCEKMVIGKSATDGKQYGLTYSSRRIDDLLEEIAGGPKRQLELEDEINRNLDNVIAKFRSDFPETPNRDVLLMCYMILHFDTSTIAILTGLSKDNVRQKRHRLIKMIDSRPGSEDELYRVLL